MSFLSDLKRAGQSVAAGIVYQANPFDGGLTYKDRNGPTYTNTSKPAAPSNTGVPYRNPAPATNLFNPNDYRGVGYSAPAKAANFDVKGVYASAYNQAAANQNALYDKYLNNFLDQQRNATAKEQNMYKTTNENLDTALRYTEEANKLKGERTTEDTTIAKDATNLQQDQFQTDTGTEFAISRIEEARKSANAGGTGGLSAQKTANTQEARNTGESRQVAKFDQERFGQELAKARDFEDIAIIGKQAQEKTTSGKKAAQFDLDNFIISSKLQEEKYRLQDQEDRQKAIKNERDAIASKQYSDWLLTLSDPVRVASASKYGASF